MFILNQNGFNLKNTFENGQCFRFYRDGTGYSGVALSKFIHLEENDGIISVSGVEKEEFERNFTDYFDLNRDYRVITESFPKEENLIKAVEYGRGMKILRQEPWEATVSFVISQNNNITRIKNTVKKLAEKYGSDIGNGNFAFPSAEELKDVKAEDYALLGCGYRSEYLENTVKSYLDGKMDFGYLSTCGYFTAKENLLKFKGIGPKVADCIALFGLHYTEAYPVDTWVKKVSETLFLKHSASKKEIEEFARSAFGEYAGFAQQYLFYYARENKIKGL